MTDEAKTMKTWTVILTADGDKTITTIRTATCASHAEVDALEAISEPGARVVCVLFGAHEPIWPKWRRRA